MLSARKMYCTSPTGLSFCATNLSTTRSGSWRDFPSALKLCGCTKRDNQKVRITSTASADSGSSGNPRPFMNKPPHRGDKSRDRFVFARREKPVATATMEDEKSRSEALDRSHIIARQAGLDKFHANFYTAPTSMGQISHAPGSLLNYGPRLCPHCCQ